MRHKDQKWYDQFTPETLPEYFRDEKDQDISNIRWAFVRAELLPEEFDLLNQFVAYFKDNGSTLPDTRHQAQLKKIDDKLKDIGMDHHYAHVATV